MKEYRTIKILVSSYRVLRMIAALTDESLTHILDRLLVAELDRVRREHNV